jgi:hypothetical protein
MNPAFSEVGVGYAVDSANVLGAYRSHEKKPAAIDIRCPRKCRNWGLMDYETSVTGQYRRGVIYIGNFKGAKPADFPDDQLT